MADIALQKISKAGAAITYATAGATGDTFKSVPGAFVHIKNASTSATRTVGFAPITTPINTAEAGSVDLPAITITIPISGERMFSVPPAYQNVGAVVALSYSSNADLTLAALYVN